MDPGELEDYMRETVMPLFERLYRQKYGVDLVPPAGAAGNRPSRIPSL